MDDEEEEETDKEGRVHYPLGGHQWEVRVRIRAAILVIRGLPYMMYAEKEEGGSTNAAYLWTNRIDFADREGGQEIQILCVLHIRKPPYFSSARKS